MEINQISGLIVDAAMKVHSALGPGLLESAYEACLIYELRKRGMKVESQVSLSVLYDGVRIDAGYRIDLMVNGCCDRRTKNGRETASCASSPVAFISQTQRQAGRATHQLSRSSLERRDQTSGKQIVIPLLLIKFPLRPSAFSAVNFLVIITAVLGGTNANDKR